MRLKEKVAGAFGPVLRAIPIESWPGAFSRLTGVLTPHAVVPHETPSASGGANIKILFEMIDRTASLGGDIAECGVWRGRSLIAMGLYADQKKLHKTLWGFDSFEGFGDSVATDIVLGGDELDVKRVGGFDNTSYALVSNKAAAFKLANVRLVPGFFEQSLAKCDAAGFSFVHLDCDIYQSYVVCLNYFYSRVVKGGAILFDEYHDPAWPGATQAVDEFFADKPEKPQSIARDNFEKWYVVKS